MAKRTKKTKPVKKAKPARKRGHIARAAGPPPKYRAAITVTDAGFTEPSPTPDPAHFVVQKNDTQYYQLLNKKLLQPIPPPRDASLTPAELIFTLQKAWGSRGAARVRQIQQAGQIVFHAVGDTGPVASKGPATVAMVADKMVEDFNEPNPADVPAFFYHLGDVVYSFGETMYYYDQYYEPFRDYPAPIIAIPGNHDGVVYSGDPESSLDAYLRNFCATSWQITAEAGALGRTAMIEPSVYFNLQAPFVNLIGLYSNVLEDPGVISSEGSSSSPVSDDQLTFLHAQLASLRDAKYAGAVIVAMHHPPYTAGSLHGASPRMLQDLDKVFSAENFYPHAVLSGHAHNYQRFTRHQGGRETPYIIAGTGGHGVVNITAGRGQPTLRVPATSGQVTLENYAVRFGYLRIVVNQQQLSIEFHDAQNVTGSKSPSDSVTVDLASRTLATRRL